METTKVPLYEIAILQKPTKKEIDEGTGTEQLVFGPKAVVARDEQAAVLSAIMGNGSTPNIDITRAEVLIRPFG